MGKKLVLSVLILGILLLGYFALKGNNIEQKKKFTFWSIQLKPVYEQEINSIISEFEKRHPDYKVTWVDIPIGEAQKRTLASILSSTPPDLVNLNPDFSILLAQKNALYLFDKKDTDQFNKGLVEKLTLSDGSIYALPFYATSSLTIYNKDIWKDCIGSSVIKNYSELNDIKDKFKNCSNKPDNMTLFVSNLNENDTLAKILNKYDISSLKTEEDKNKTISLFSTFNDLYKEDLMPKDTLSINHREVIEKYMSEGALLTVTGSNFVNMVKQNAYDVYQKSELAYQLTGSNGKYDVALMNLIIPKKSQNIDLALEFALTLTNKENQLELSKITNVLPANKYALQDDYFKNCSSDLVDKSRCLSAKQLASLNTASFGNNNKKTINETLNKTLEEILLNGTSNNSDNETIKTKIENLAKKIQILQEN